MLLVAPLRGAHIVVSNERAGTVTMIDGSTNRVVRTVAVGTRPRGILISPDGKRIFVAISHFWGVPSKTPDEVVALDAASLKIVSHYPAETSNTVTVIDAHRGVVTANIFVEAST